MNSAKFPPYNSPGCIRSILQHVDCPPSPEAKPGKSKDKAKNSKKDKLFNIYRPNTGQAVKVETLTDLKKKYKKCSWEKVQTEAKKHWSLQFEASEKQCSHAYW